MPRLLLPLSGLLLLLPALGADEVKLPFVFRDVTREAGLIEPLKGMMGHGAAWGDVDGDGQIDLFVGTFADRPAKAYEEGGAKGPVPNALLLGRKGKFEASKEESIAKFGRVSGVALADLDNDGLPDLYVTNNGGKGKEKATPAGNLLYHNRGKGKFDLVTDKAGAALNTPEIARSVAVLDFDGDGLLDLFVLATKGDSILFRNVGGMKFERSKALPDGIVGLGVAVGDLTGDGWPSLFVGGPNRLFVAQGDGKFREAKELKLDWGFRAEDDAPSCGVAFGDFDRNGKLDLLIGSHTKQPCAKPVPIRLFRNLGCTKDKAAFEEVTEKVGLGKIPMRSPHVEMRDFDNDGWPDLYASIVVHKDGKHYPAVWKNQGVKKEGELPRFVETAFVHRPDFPTKEDYSPKMKTAEFYDALIKNGRVTYYAPGPSGDYDNDGRLDLFLPNWWPTRPSLLLRNETPSGNYLAVEVVGKKQINRMGLGCVVRAYAAGEAGKKGAAFVSSEQIATGYGYASAQPAVAHLGLGKRESCDVVVTLPYGKGEVVKKGVKANQKLRIEVP